jgi:hypothetical protein
MEAQYSRNMQLQHATAAQKTLARKVALMRREQFVTDILRMSPVFDVNRIPD